MIIWKFDARREREDGNKLYFYLAEIDGFNGILLLGYWAIQQPRGRGQFKRKADPQSSIGGLRAAKRQIEAAKASIAADRMRQSAMARMEEYYRIKIQRIRDRLHESP